MGDPTNPRDLITQALMARGRTQGAPAFLGGQVVAPGTFDERFGTLSPAGGTTEIPRTPPVEQRFPTPEEQLTPYAPEPDQIVDKQDYTFMDQEAEAYRRFLEQQQTGQTQPPGQPPGTQPPAPSTTAPPPPSLIDTFNPFTRLPWGSGFTNPSISPDSGAGTGGAPPTSLAGAASAFSADDDRDPKVRRANEAARRAAAGLPPLNFYP